LKRISVALFVEVDARYPCRIEHGVGDDLCSALGRGQKLHVPSEDGHDDLGDETE
jgi:hypothetical protein